MELVEGADACRADHAGSIPVAEAIAFARQLAAALDSAHERGIIHRDLKPANIKITTDGSIKVLDFGLAKAMATDAAATFRCHTLTDRVGMGTADGVIIGTAAYMSPEQARGQRWTSEPTSGRSAACCSSW